MRLLFILGSRGEWGYIRPVIDVARSRGHEAFIAALNMAVLSRFGDLAARIQEQGYDVRRRMLTAFSGDTHNAMAKSIGAVVMSVTDILEAERPDWLILAGDRAEQLGAAVAGSYTYTPTAHIQAGERSGNIDEVARHAIARLAHLHFASNEDAEQRLIRSGEAPMRVRRVGAPQIDDLLRVAPPSVAELRGRRVAPNREFLLACLHPVTEELHRLETRTSGLLEVLRSRSEAVVWILPNNDPGGDLLRQLVIKGARAGDIVHTNLDRRDFAGLMASAAAMVGNSSSGLLEAPSFELPAVNIGQRQRNRVRGMNVIDVDWDSSAIADAITAATSPEMRQSIRGMDNPYGDGSSAPRIVSAIEEIRINQDFLAKSLEY